jgi:hypothetical protein
LKEAERANGPEDESRMGLVFMLTQQFFFEICEGGVRRWMQASKLPAAWLGCRCEPRKWGKERGHGESRHSASMLVEGE